MKVQIDDKGIENLFVSAKIQAICPFKPVIIINTISGPQQAMQNCNSVCPHFHFIKNTQELKLTCGATVRVINLKSDIQPNI